MAKNKLSDGNLLTVTAPADVVAGQVMKIGSLTGVVENDAKSGQPVVIARRGVYNLTKGTSEQITAGTVVYADSSNVITATSSGSTKVGIAVATAVTTASTVKVTLVD